MIHLLPQLKEQINSKRTPEEIYKILKSVTDSRKVVFSTNAEFTGQVRPLDFRIVPKINYINSFLPIVTGYVMENDGGTTIDLTLQMHILTRIYLICWCGMACFIFVCGTIAVFTGGLEKITLILASLGLIIFSQVLIRCGFCGPARNVLKRLKELLC